MNPLLVIWTARNIPTCQYHFRTLTGIDKLWIYGHTEWELAHALPTFLADHPEYTHAVFTADDGIITQQALASVLHTASLHPDAAVGGWSNCDFTHHYTNIGTLPLVDDAPVSMKSYGHLVPIDVVAEKREPFRAVFCGHSLFTLTREAWIDPATRLHPCGTGGGHASDYAQCKRLQDAGVPVWIDPFAFVPHLKLNHLEADTAGWKRLDLSNKGVLLEVAA